jgi:hypothetical protein
MATSRKLEFLGSQGAPLAARLDLPEAEPHAYALFARLAGRTFRPVQPIHPSAGLVLDELVARCAEHPAQHLAVAVAGQPGGRNGGVPGRQVRLSSRQRQVKRGRLHLITGRGVR